MSGWKSQLTSQYVNARYGETVALLQSVGLEVDPVVVLQAVAGLKQHTTITAEASVISPKLYHIIITGQSNSIGTDSNPVILTTPARGRMFSGGLKPGSGGLGSYIQLEEGQATTEGQTVSTSMVNWLAQNAINSNDVILVSHVGVDSAGYTSLKKGTAPYDDSLAHILAAKTIADASGIPYEILGIVSIHGETDDAFQNTNYAANVIQWQSDYDTDIKALTSQTKDVIMFFPHQSAARPEQYNGGSSTLAGASALNLLAASQSIPGKVILTGPECFLDFKEHPHFSPFSHVWLGEYIARAIKQTVIDGIPFVPLVGTSASLLGNEITITYNVPSPPIKFDYRYTGHHLDQGFSFWDTDGTTTVTDVQITGPAEITLTLSQVPLGTSPQVRYMTRGSNADPKSINAGNVVDSSNAPSEIGMPAHNFGVAFLLPLD